MLGGIARSGALARLVGLCLLAGVLVAGMAFPVAGGLGLASNRASDTVNSLSADLASGRLPLLTTITDSAGVPFAYLYDQDRIPVASQDIAPAMKAAIVAIEDRRFYQHGGVDWQATLRALLHNQGSDATQGGSTLTQQYVKNYDLYVAAHTEAERIKAIEPTYARKLKEARIAIQLDGELSKDEILTRYLNIVFEGNGIYGVGAAARTYFGTTADKLTVPQAALLAGMVQSPSFYDPLAHPRAALDRRNEVIRQMQQQGMITVAQASEALAAPLGVLTPLNPPANGCIGAGDAGFFCDYAVEYLGQAGIPADAIRTGGYTIRTTLDRHALAKAKAAVDAEVPPNARHVADVMSIVAPGQDSHPVLAMVANRTFGLDASSFETTYDLPYQPENLGAGSVYKIFTAATALERGMGIDTVIPVPPSGYASPIYRDASGHPYPVANDGHYAAQLTLQDALAQSPNTAFVKLEETTGISPVVDMAVRLGLRSLATTPANPSRPDGPSIADVTKAQNLASFTLGTTPTSVLELANVAATLASHGRWCPPDPIVNVTGPDGRPVPMPTEPCQQAVPPGLADTLLVGLSKDDQPGGTSAATAGSLHWSRPVAAKTGTTEQYKSAAFVGAVPQLVGSVIVFDDSASPRPICDGSPPYTCSSGNIYGGNAPARTWYSAMTAILGDQPAQPLPAADPGYVNGGTAVGVPDVLGQPVADATAQLRQAGFPVTVQNADDRAPAGTVVAENPRGRALAGTPVTILVSTGSVPPPPPPPLPPAGNR